MHYFYQLFFEIATLKKKTALCANHCLLLSAEEKKLVLLKKKIFSSFNPYPQKPSNDIGLFIIIEGIVGRP